MSDLYLIFFLVSAILFVLIVAYSVLTQRRKKSEPDDDALFDDDALLADDALQTSQNNVSPQQVKQAEAAIADAHHGTPIVEADAIVGEPQSIAIPERYEPQSELPEVLTGQSPQSTGTEVPPKVTSHAPQQATEPEPQPQRSSTEAVLPKAVIAKPEKKSFTQKIADKVIRKNHPVEDNVVESDVSTNVENEQPLERVDVRNEDGSSMVVTELVAKMKNPLPVEQQELLSVFRLHDFKFHRKVHIFGLNQLTDLWRDIEFELPSARFVELGVSIQLADRDGAMSEKESHDFQQMTLEFSNKFDAPFEFSVDIDDALRQADLLDQMGRRYDSMAVLNVVPKTKNGFRIADIESCARDLMMSSDKNGIFMKTEGRKHDLSVLYRLACTDGQGHFGLSSSATTTVHDLVVYMNVPATQAPETVFEQMVKDANSLATWLEGKVVDRNGRTMTQRSYSVLMQQISGIVFSMQQDGLMPGDVVSKKLF